MLDPRWSSIMQEVDRLYWANTTHEGRINCIADYVIRELNAQNNAAPNDALVDAARAQMERDCAAMCDGCSSPSAYTPEKFQNGMGWIHARINGNQSWLCDASRIRSAYALTAAAQTEKDNG